MQACHHNFSCCAEVHCCLFAEGLLRGSSCVLLDAVRRQSLESYLPDKGTLGSDPGSASDPFTADSLQYVSTQPALSTTAYMHMKPLYAY